jgi:hypothetical protein
VRTDQTVDIASSSDRTANGLTGDVGIAPARGITQDSSMKDKTRSIDSLRKTRL